MKATRAREILGVSKPAGEDEIEAAYRELVKENHPDVSDDPNATERFLEIKTAKQTLTGHSTGGESGRKTHSRSTNGKRESSQSRSERSGSKTRSRRSKATASHSGSTSTTHVDQSEESSWRSQRTERSKNTTSRNRHRERTEAATPSARQAESGWSGWPLIGRAILAVILGPTIYVAYLLGAVLINALVFEGLAFTVVYVCCSAGLAWVGRRLPLSATGTVGLLVLTFMVLAAVNPEPATIGVYLLFGAPITAAAVGIVYGVIMRYYGVSLTRRIRRVVVSD